MYNKFFNYNEPPSDDFTEKYGERTSYDDCAIEGYCSVDPIMYSLMEVMLYELKQLAYYYVKMQELGYENKKIKDKIINYLSLILIGYKFNRDEFQKLLSELHKEKEGAKNSYIKVCDENNIDCQILKSNIKFEKYNLASLVQQGEKQAIKRNNKQRLYKIG